MTNNHGNDVIKLVTDAPIPSATNNVGKAQQIKVLKLVNKLKEGEINCLKGRRHRQSLPVRGQRTRTNARTRRGSKNTVTG